MRQGPQKALTGSALDSRVAQFGQRSFVRSVQRGTITISTGTSSNTATITTVVPENAFVTLASTLSVTGNAEGLKSVLVRLALTNATTVTTTRAGTDTTRDVAYEVIEFWPGVIKSKQQGTITVSGASTGTATISAVTMVKSIVVTVGFTMINNGVQPDAREYPGNTFLFDSTTVKVQRSSNDAAYAGTFSYQVVEFY